jgi:glucosylceramidase
VPSRFHNPDRRQILKLSASAVALAAIRPAHALGFTPASGLRGWTTAPGKLHQPIDLPAWQHTAPAANAIMLDPAATFQELLGFGGAFTDASCWLFSQMPAPARRALLEELFGPQGLNLSVGRTTIGASDYSRSAYSYDESPQPDPQLTHFSIDHDRPYILPTLREAAEVNPQLYLFGSPWSPPGWMKANNSLLGGSMRKHYFAAYAQYFVRYLQDYAGAGVPIRAVTVQNEVDTDQDGRMPQALWGQEYEIEFVTKHLGPALQAAGLDTKIWFLDHNYNLWGRVLDSLSNPQFLARVDGVAWHGYVGSPETMTRVHDAYPTVNAYWTEGGPDFVRPGQDTNWSFWSTTFTGILRNWSRAIVCWNLLLDQDGKPDIGPFKCRGLVTLNTATGELTRCGQYHAFAHFSRHMQRGARIIASKSDPNNSIEHVAARNPDGSTVLVLTNPKAAQPATVAHAGQTLTIELPGDSVTTLVW